MKQFENDSPHISGIISLALGKIAENYASQII